MISRSGLFLALALSGCSTPDFAVQAPTPVLDACGQQAATGKTCGVACPLCGLGDACDDASDCTSGLCTDNVCADPAPPDPTCTDLAQNGTETDVDCGGSCVPCVVDQHCARGSDCATLVCNSVCQPANCTDHVRNGGESAVDCGGSCASCALGASCQKNSDCMSGSCSGNLCVAGTCSDSIKNGDETDKDCGGSCKPCSAGLACIAGTDCDTLSCSSGKTCLKPSCTDNIKNGTETDTDCGGSCKPCIDGALCKVPADCSSALCKGTFCVPKAATGGALVRTGWTATATNSTSNSTPADALDGNLSTRWSSGAAQYSGMTYTLDMQSPRVFFGFTLDSVDSPGDGPALFDVYLSLDGTFPTPPGPVQKGLVGMDLTTVTFKDAQVARYIKIVLTQGKSNWWGIRELNVTD